MKCRPGIFVVVLCLPCFAWGEERPAPQPVDYLTQIKPILTARCVACHGALKQESGLRLDTAELLKKGGAGGPAIVPGNVRESELIARIVSTDESIRMPREGEHLSAEQVEAIKQWILNRAPAPADEQPEKDPREHWSFKSVVRPTVPKAETSNWSRNPIDNLIAEKQIAHGIRPTHEASRLTLIRRVYLDLVGVPPTPAEWKSLESANQPDWYERLVDRLLADPRHGERWARHWMDIWRYSDWWGFVGQVRNSHPHIWHWRDWIIESLNEDLGYDEMVRLMLAADELHPQDLGRLRASGFLVRNFFLLNRNQWLDETVEHVSKGFLGLTINCAKCHDHKYDPIEQADYYRMRAIFEPYQIRAELLPGMTSLETDSIPHAFDGVLDAPTYLFERGNENQPDKSKVIEPGVPSKFRFVDLQIKPLALPNEAWQPARRPWVIDAYLAVAKQKVSSAENSHRAAKEQWERLKTSALPNTGPASKSQTAPPASNPQLSVAQAQVHLTELELSQAKAELVSLVTRSDAMRAAWTLADVNAKDPALANAERNLRNEAILAERACAVAKARLQVLQIEQRLAKSAKEQKDSVEKELSAARESLKQAISRMSAGVQPTDRFEPIVGAKWVATRFHSSTVDDAEVKFPANSTGRRTALAEWMTNPKNPLTARVAVNHLWARHLGTPLVPTVFDLGRKGSSPVQNELLDWLAAEFMDSGWNMKHIHRLIVTSATYRLSSDSGNQQLDPENVYYGRRTPIRLESQVVRDSILLLAGKLDTKIGGPQVPPTEQERSTRRSIYFFHSNNDRDRFLTTFDEASVKECYRRDQSIVPQQALALSNSSLVHEAAAPIANRISGVVPATTTKNDEEAFIREAFKEILGANASELEMAACKRAMDEWRQQNAASPENVRSSVARRYLIWAMLNHNDFVTIR